MCGRVTLVSLFLSLLLTSPAVSQCSWTPGYSGQFRTSALDVSTAGDGYLWLATGYGIQLFDLSTPASHRLVDSIAVPGITRVVHAAAGGVTYAGSGANLLVLRREASRISIVRSIDAGGTVQDIVANSNLFVATSKGIAHYDLIDVTNPTRTNVVLPSTSLSVTSLAVAGTTLYAADGDTTIQMYSITNPSLPQGTGTLESLPRTSAVHFAGGFLFASDQFGQATDVFSGATRLARITRGATAFAAGSGNVRFMSGPDRTLRVSDLSIPDRPIDILETSLPATDGTDNLIHAMTVSGSTLYVAAGDIGLVVLDAGALSAPYPVAAYSTGATTSVVAVPGRAWFTLPSGTISQQKIDPTGISLLTERSWEAGAGTKVQEVSGDTLLTSNGNQTRIWSLTPQTPAAGPTATFPAAVRTAMLRGSGVLALLEDGTVWNASPTPQQTALPKTTAMARFGSALAFLEAKDNGTTVLHYYATGDFNAQPGRTTISGLPIGGLALDATHAAVFTFNGVSIIDVATSTAHVVPGSAAAIPLQMAFAGGDLLILTSSELFVFDDAATLARRTRLPAGAIAMAAATPQVVMATQQGRLVSTYLAALPAAAFAISNSFYRDAAAGTSSLVLSSPARIDLFSTAFGNAPHFTRTIPASGVIGSTASGSFLYTLTASGALTVWSRAGAQTAQKIFSEGNDATPLSVDAVGGAIWVAYSKGCLAGSCRKETYVLDPLSLIVTSTINGQAVDAAVSGKRAYVLFDFPDEMRVLDLNDPLHPLQLASAAASASARSIAHTANKVVVLGDRIETYSDTTLAPAGMFLTPVTATSANRVRIDGNCGVLSGRAFNPELYDVRTWTPLPLPAEMPSGIRTFLMQTGKLTFLTDHSIEVWNAGAPVPAPRRRGVR